MFLYLTDFYHLITDNRAPKGGQEHHTQETARFLVAQPSPSYPPRSKNKRNSLPGAVVEDSKNFDKNETKDPSQRDANMLPGAIGLSGAFDEHDGGVLEAPAPGPSKQAARSTLPSQSKADPTKAVAQRTPDASGPPKTSKRDASPSTATPFTSTEDAHQISVVAASKPKKKNGAKKKRRKKKRLKNLKEGPKRIKASNSTNESSNRTGRKRRRRRKRSRPRKRKAKKASSRSDTQMPTVTPTRDDFYSGAHPMNRQMAELQVPGGTDSIDESSVKEHYGKLVKAYLAPFSKGIERKSLFEVIRRKTYSLSPPGSNKGIQTILFQLLNKSKNLHVSFLPRCQRISLTFCLYSFH